MRWFSRIAELFIRLFDALNWVEFPEGIQPRRLAMMIGCAVVGTLAVYGLFVFIAR